MNQTSRREMFAKLGAGAAALTALSVAGTAAAAPITAVKTTPTRIAVTSPRTEVLVKSGQTSIQVNVGIDKQGFIFQTSSSSSKVGLTSDAKVLQLGVKIKDGGVEVTGLEGLLNRGGDVSAEGRCTMRTDPGAAVVLPGNDLVQNSKNLAKF